MAARGSSIKERTEPPPPPRELTVEAIRQRAVDAGVAAQFDRFVRMSENAGLAVQPQRVSVRIVPQAGRKRYLTYASPEGEGLVLWAGQGPLRPTRAWHKWSWSSARSSTRNCKSGQSSSTARTTCAGTCCYACWRTTWNGTCGGGWRRYCPRSAFLPGRAGSRLASGQQAVQPRSPSGIPPCRTSEPDTRAMWPSAASALSQPSIPCRGNLALRTARQEQARRPRIAAGTMLDWLALQPPGRSARAPGALPYGTAK